MHMDTLGTNHESRPLTRNQFYDFLSGAGNHELKLLTGAVILAHSDIVYTPASLRRTLLDRQGAPTVWKFQASTPAQYCEQSLEPIGAVVTSKVLSERNKIVPGYQACATNRFEKLALAGSLLGWSLDYSDISVQNVLGATASNSSVRSPEVRHQIYRSLLTGSDGIDVSSLYEKLDGLGYKHRPSMNLQLYRMHELGLIKLDSNIGQNPSVLITHTEFDALSKKLEDSLPETQAIYAAIRRLGIRCNTTVNNIVTVAIEINPNLDATVVRYKLLNGVNGKGFSGLQLTENPSQQRTTVFLNPTITKPVSDLCERLKDVRDGAVDVNVRAARRIIESKPDFRKLTAKARQFSHAVAGKQGHELLEKQLLSIVNRSGETTVSVARDELKNTYAREISSHMLRRILNDKVKEGKLQQDVIYRHSHSTKSTRVYKTYPQPNQ